MLFCLSKIFSQAFGAFAIMEMSCQSMELVLGHMTPETAEGLNEDIRFSTYPS